MHAVDLAQRNCRIVTSEYIIAEFQAVLKSKKFKWPKALVDRACAEMFDGVLFVEPEEILAVARDAKDNPILACALAAKTGIIVTGDNDLLVLKQYKSAKILTPKAFVQLWQ